MGVAGITSGRTFDLVGAGVAAVLVLWVGFAAGGASAGSDAGDEGRVWTLIFVVSLVAAVSLGRLGATWDPPVVPAAAAVGVTLLLVTALPRLHETSGPPLGYANANATFASLGALSAVGAATLSSVAGRSPVWARSWRRSRAPGRQRGRAGWPWLALAVALLSLVLVPASVGAVMCLGTAAAVAGAAAWFRRPRLAVAGGAVAVAVTLGATVVIALGADPAGLGTRSEARGELWAGAVELVREEPWWGKGPGTFADLNPVTDDEDLRWAHHGYLQVAAELGLPGAALALGLVAWAYGRLWLAGLSVRCSRAFDRHPDELVEPDPRMAGVVVGAMAVTVLALHAAIDYVVHFPILPLTVAGLLGWATGGTQGSDLDRRDPAWFGRRAPV